MKPVVSFLLQLSPQTAYGNLEAVARNLSDGLEILLNYRKVKCSIFMDGPTMEMLKKTAKPLSIGRIKAGVDEGLVEFLGGGYYDPMLPLFPKDLQVRQLKKHRSKLKSFLGLEPQGYFNSSLVWEMGMISVLEECAFDYALVSEAAVREALGRNSPVSGWFTVEDQGSLMRVVPVSDELSKAIDHAVQREEESERSLGYAVVLRKSWHGKREVLAQEIEQRVADDRRHQHPTLPAQKKLVCRTHIHHPPCL